MTAVDLPSEISEPLRALLPALADLGYLPISAEYSENSFGNFIVRFQRPDTASFQLTRDRGQFIIYGIPQDELESAGLWRAFDVINELQPLLIRLLGSQTKS